APATGERASVALRAHGRRRVQGSGACGEHAAIACERRLAPRSSMFNSSLICSGPGNGEITRTFGVLVSACMVGPDYRRPDVDVPAAWRLGPTEAGEISNIAWWDQFQDPVLSNLVRTALANNKDLEIATANVDQAAAQYGIVRSAQFPQLSGTATAERQRLSENTALGSGTGR